MKIYYTNDEVLADVKDGVLTIKGAVEFRCAVSIKANINAWDIIAGNINAGDITAGNITAGNINAVNIKAGNINAYDINAYDINAGNINAGDIKAGNINAYDINAYDINAGNISFFAVCFAYVSFVCKSITGRRNNSRYFCLDSEVKLKESGK